MKIEQYLNSEDESIIYISNAQLDRLVNQLGLLSTSTMTDAELVEFVSFKRSIREHLNHHGEYLRNVAVAPVLDETLNKPPKPEGINNFVKHESHITPANYPDCPICKTLITEGF